MRQKKQVNRVSVLLLILGLSAIYSGVLQDRPEEERRVIRLGQLDAARSHSDSAYDVGHE